ncbi:hypothetical protein DLREEDagrD3_12250 [Denitratisoma sp. agr-D3]
MRLLPRFCLPLLLTVLVPAALAQTPKNLQPLPEVPPPPPGVNLDADLEPQVTITRKGEDQVEEYRINGQLYMIKVTPVNGPTYYLVDEEGKGTWARRDNLGSNVRPPMWLIKSW